MQFSWAESAKAQRPKRDPRDWIWQIWRIGRIACQAIDAAISQRKEAAFHLHQSSRVRGRPLSPLTPPDVRVRIRRFK